jgi:hypothetical protein
MRDKLLYHKWVDIVKHDSNPSQTFHRIRTKLDRTFDDFELLLAKLPEEKEEELFSLARIRKFIEALLGDEYGTIQKRKSQIAFLFVEVGLKFLISQHSLLSKRTPFLSQTTTDQLWQSFRICREIADEIQSRYLESKTQRERIFHIFDWESVPGEHAHRLKDYLLEQTRLKLRPEDLDPKLTLTPGFTTQFDGEFERIEYKTNKKLEWKFLYEVVWLSFSESAYNSNEHHLRAIIEIQSEQKATLRIVDECDDDKELHKEELLVQKEKNDLHILRKY